MLVGFGVFVEFFSPSCSHMIFFAVLYLTGEPADALLVLPGDSPLQAL